MTNAPFLGCFSLSRLLSMLPTGILTKACYKRDAYLSLSLVPTLSAMQEVVADTETHIWKALTISMTSG
jgi:hypothetical protein